MVKKEDLLDVIDEVKVLLGVSDDCGCVSDDCGCVSDDCGCVSVVILFEVVDWNGDWSGD
jgi:hypothetical protein